MSSVSATCRAAIYERDRHTCQAAALLGKACTGELTVHHLVPSEDGGGNEHSNLLTVCRGHHDTIHFMTPRAHGVQRAVHARQTAEHLARMRAIGLLREPADGARKPKSTVRLFTPKMPPPTALGPVVPYRSKALADVYKVPTPKTAPGKRRRRPAPEPMEWVDPNTGQMYLLTPRGGRPVEVDEAGEGVALAG